MLGVLCLRNLVVNLMVGFVELVPVMVDVCFPLGNIMAEKGLVGLRKLFRFPCVNPAPVKAYNVLAGSFGLEKCPDVRICWKLVCLLGRRVEVVQNGMGHVNVLPNFWEGNEVDPSGVVSYLGVYTGVGVSFTAVRLRECRRKES